MLPLLLFAIVMGAFLLGRYEERAKFEDLFQDDLEGLKRLYRAGDGPAYPTNKD